MRAAAARSWCRVWGPSQSDRGGAWADPFRIGHAMIKILCNEGSGANTESPREIPILPPKTSCGGPLGTFIAKYFDHSVLGKTTSH